MSLTSPKNSYNLNLSSTSFPTQYILNSASTTNSVWTFVANISPVGDYAAQKKFTYNPWARNAKGVELTCIAGGGAGGVIGTILPTDDCVGGGGGGGAACTLFLTPAQYSGSLVLYLGLGGVAVNDNSSIKHGSATKVFNSNESICFANANPGLSGLRGETNPSVGGSGGYGGAADYTSSFVTSSTSGSDGSPAHIEDEIYPGYGGAAGATRWSGGQRINNIDWSLDPVPGYPNINGKDGYTYGGGGTGATRKPDLLNTNVAYPGSGANGAIIITEYF